MDFSSSVALVCASNQNRSVEAHAMLLSKGYKNVWSFGTSNACRLPGPSIDKPNVYPFGTPYKHIYEDLKKQNPELYKSNGLLPMLQRNMKVKPAPERFQDEKRHFDVIITFEDRVFDSVVEDLSNRESDTCGGTVHVFNISTKDNHDEALVGASQALQLVHMLRENGDWEENLDSLLEAYQKRTGKEILHQVVFY
eukprot:TRINITY_DN9116_c0_g1_i1.p1 TRINITY_DN9116_c0_g1~~TRINITY_DN9116_c0_g1_i1.p1  ORF type:complete len:196 (-),score=24.34 TRINITY_DN9116_c0_g1_i1:15-602(-)